MPPPMPPHEFFHPLVFGSEIIFTVVAVFFCFLIYFKTKDIYDLTKHYGIKYFRDAFLFIGLSYLLRFLFGIIMFSRFAFDFIVPQRMFMPLFILPLGYFSTIGIFYLIFGTVWKNINHRIMVIIGHIVAIILTVVSFLTRSHFILIIMQLALLILAVVLIIFGHREKKDKKKFSQIKILYLMVAFLWLINLGVFQQGRPIMFDADLIIEAISLIVFLFIYYRVSKWVT